MIAVEETERWCNSCLTKHGNFSLIVGLDSNSTTSLSLCDACRKEVVEKFQIADDDLVKSMNSGSIVYLVEDTTE